MKLPKRVKIGGHKYKVLFPYIFKERFDHWAQCDFAMKELRIGLADGGGQDKVDSAVIVTFIHEILHAIDFTTGHAIFADNEPAIEGFSEGIYQVLVDNGWLKKEMFG